MRRKTQSVPVRRFTVKLVSSKADRVQFEQIESLLVARGYDSTLVEYSSVDKFLLELGHHRTNILVVSGKSVSPDKFESMISRATRRYPFDVLYYDVHASASVKSRLLSYSTVRINPGKQFLDTLTEMIDANPLKWHSPRYIRGLVISRSVDMEAAIDNYIIRHMAGSKKLDAATQKRLHELLYDYAMALRSKRQILEMIMTVRKQTDKPILKLIDSIGQSRNTLAHTWLGLDDTGTVISSHTKDPGSPGHAYTRQKLWKILQDIDRIILYLDAASHGR